MRLAVATLVWLVAGSGGGMAKQFEKCELATVLEAQHGMPREDVKSWVCIAEYESTFNTEAINKFNWDGSFDYGLFQLNDKYWCDDHTGKNVCRMPCSDLLDDDLTDDLRCIKKIIRDTERWKGKDTGLTAWVAYVKRCQYRNLDKYMEECWVDPQPATTDQEPIDNLIPRLPEVAQPEVPDEPGTPDIPDDPPNNEIGNLEDELDKDKVMSEPPTGSLDADNVLIIPSARIPYPAHHALLVSSQVPGIGSTAIHVRSRSKPIARGSSHPSNRPRTVIVRTILPQSQKRFLASNLGHRSQLVPLLVPRPALLPYSAVRDFKLRAAEDVKLKGTRLRSSATGASLTVYEKLTI